MPRLFFVLGCLAATLGVAAGAFGAHALEGRLSEEMMATFETGVLYHLVHALGLFAAAWAASRWPGSAVTAGGILLALGIVVFSGSLYLLVLTETKWLGAITPIGGLAFLAGWICLGTGVLLK